MSTTSKEGGGLGCSNSRANSSGEDGQRHHTTSADGQRQARASAIEDICVNNSSQTPEGCSHILQRGFSSSWNTSSSEGCLCVFSRRRQKRVVRKVERKRRCRRCRSLALNGTMCFPHKARQGRRGEDNFAFGGLSERQTVLREGHLNPRSPQHKKKKKKRRGPPAFDSASAIALMKTRHLRTYPKGTLVSNSVGTWDIKCRQ